MMGLPVKKPSEAKAAHTAGPWKVVPDDKFPTLCKIVCIDGDVLDEGFVCSRKHEMANARLIAAAPCMLEALENALEAFNPKECNCDAEYDDGRLVGHACYFHRIEQDIRAAIAKALGGEG